MVPDNDQLIETWLYLQGFFYSRCSKLRFERYPVFVLPGTIIPMW